MNLMERLLRLFILLVGIFIYYCIKRVCIEWYGIFVLVIFKKLVNLKELIFKSVFIFIFCCKIDIYLGGEE